MRYKRHLSLSHSIQERITPNHNPNYLFARRWWLKLIHGRVRFLKSIEPKTRHQNNSTVNQSFSLRTSHLIASEWVSQPASHSAMWKLSLPQWGAPEILNILEATQSVSPMIDPADSEWTESGQIDPTDWFRRNLKAARRHSKGMGGSDNNICTKWSMKNVSNSKSYLVNKLKLMLQQMMMLPPRTQPSKISWNDVCDGVVLGGVGMRSHFVTCCFPPTSLHCRIDRTA